MQYNLMVKSIFGLGACSLGRNPSPGKLVALVHTLVPMGRILNEFPCARCHLALHFIPAGK